MTEFYSGRRLWERLGELTAVSGRRQAAIAYIGPNANDYLQLGVDDVLVFDGDDRSIRNNHVHLPTIEALMQAGVQLYSYAGLHAKMIVVEAAEPFAIVGSPNASRTSVEKKSEAAVRIDDAAAVQAVRLAIFELQAESKRLDQAWLRRVSTLARIDRHGGSKVARPPASSILARPASTLWISRWAAPARQRAAGSPILETVRLAEPADATIFDSVEIDDSLLLLNWDGSTRRPRANAAVWEPGRVLTKRPDPHSGGTVVVAWRRNVERRQWREVEAAITPQGDDWNSGELRPVSRRAVWQLFRQQPTRAPDPTPA